MVSAQLWLLGTHSVDSCVIPSSHVCVEGLLFILELQDTPDLSCIYTDSVLKLAVSLRNHSKQDLHTGCAHLYWNENVILIITVKD